MEKNCELIGKLPSLRIVSMTVTIAPCHSTRGSSAFQSVLPPPPEQTVNGGGFAEGNKGEPSFQKC
eukprot:2061795-Amphidinium_carterae.1